VGKRGPDDLGDLFETDLDRAGVERVLFTSQSTPTGRVLSVVSPDAQRSMLTYLGAAAEQRPEEITDQCFEGAAVVHIEGYLSFNPDLLTAAIRSAKAAGARISLDMASYTVVEAAKPLLERIIQDDVDILMANEDEARVYTGCADEGQALESLAASVDIAVLKVGRRGSFIAGGGDRIRVAAKGNGQAKDTTGAGDLWAAGFLYGLVNGLPLDRCGELGSLCGHEVCQVDGAHIPESGWARIQTAMAAFF
jgi:sugar/nucleoside kinase (ribokinase family)